MANKRKTTTKAVTNRSMRKIKPANDITEIKRPSPEPSLIPIPMLRNSFQTTPPLNSSRLPIMLENSFEDIISEFNEKFQKIDERFDQLEINFNNYTNTEKPTNLSENVKNKVIELNETILALRSENAQLLEKIRLLESNSPPNIDSNGLQLVEWTKVTKKIQRKRKTHDPNLPYCLPYRHPNLPKRFIKQKIHP